MVRMCCDNYHMPVIGTQSNGSTKKEATGCLEEEAGGQSEKASQRRSHLNQAKKGVGEFSKEEKALQLKSFLCVVCLGKSEVPGELGYVMYSHVSMTTPRPSPA